MKSYLKNILVGFDQFINTLFGGMPGETLSSRIGRAAHKDNALARALRRVLNWLVPGHTEGAMKHDMERAEQVEETEAKDLGLPPE